MKLNMKAFGLALVAMFAMSAVVASAASAETKYTAESGSAAIDATRSQSIGSPAEFFEGAGAKITCEHADFTANLKEASSHLLVTPNYTDATEEGNCRAGGVLKVIVTENGCQYTFETPEIMGEGESKDHTLPVEIVCPEGKLIDVHITRLFSEKSACTITIPGQTLTGRITAENNSGDVEISGVVGVHVQVHHNSELCGAKPEETIEEEATYTISESSPLTVTSETTNIDIGPVE